MSNIKSYKNFSESNIHIINESQYLDECPSYDELNYALDKLKILIDRIKTEFTGDEEYILDYIDDKLGGKY